MRMFIVDRLLDASAHGPKWWRDLTFALSVWVYEGRKRAA